MEFPNECSFVSKRYDVDVYDRGGGREEGWKKQTNLIPNKHPSPILVLHQFPYFPIGEVHSKVEVAHPNLQQKKRAGEARARAKAKCERAFTRDSRFVKGVKGDLGKTYE